MSKWELFCKAFKWKTVLSGLSTTVQIAVFGLCIGILIGTIVAVSKVIPSRNKFVKAWAAVNSGYVWLFRGTPVVVQLLLTHFALFPLMGLQLGSINEALLIFGLNSGAYVSEIMRSGILSVDKGQMEAGRSLGISYPVTMGSVVLPQAVKNILPTIGNEFIALVKETSVVSFIAVMDLTRVFQNIGKANYEYFVPYAMLAVFYLAIVTVITILIRVLEKQLRRSDTRGEDGADYDLVGKPRWKARWIRMKMRWSDSRKRLRERCHRPSRLEVGLEKYLQAKAAAAEQTEDRL